MYRRRPNKYAHKDEAEIMAEPAFSQYEKPDIESEIEQALAICGGDTLAALRATLIANAFLERRVELSLAGQSAGYARGRVRKASVTAKKKDDAID